MSRSDPPVIRIIGVGNEMRGDDGVGPFVARGVVDGLPSNAEALIAPGDGAVLMDLWQGADFVILVDAVRRSGAPGTIHRLNADTETLPSSFFHYSTHAFSVAEAVEMGRALGMLPPRLLVFGIEGKRFDVGCDLSREAAEGVKKVVEMIRAEIFATLRPTNSDGGGT